MSPESNDFVTLARVVKTQGRRGEVAAEIHTDVPDRFTAGMKVSAIGESDSRRELEIEDFWPHKGWIVLKFAGIDSISDAEKLIGTELQVPQNHRAQLEPGWAYVSDLVGCTLFDHGNGIGRIADVEFGAGEAPLLVVSRGQECRRQSTFEVPFAEAYLESVDLPKREVRMNLPEGIFEINAPITDEEKREQQAAARKGKRPQRK